MPRKTAGGGDGGRRAACFNEAAARCRGKLGRQFRGLTEQEAASMRPRPDAAENAHPFGD